MDGMRREAERSLQKQLREAHPNVPAYERRKLARALVAQAMKNLTQEANA